MDMTDLDLLIDLHKGTERQGPGSVSETTKALDLMAIDKNQALTIADIGCGSGGQTFTLARHLKGQIYAVDLFPEFLTELNAKAKELDFHERIKTIKASMDDLPFKKEELDIIWSEGAIYNIGFEKRDSAMEKILEEGRIFSCHRDYLDHK